MILHTNLNVQVHECWSAVYLFAAAKLGSSLATLFEISGNLESLGLLMHICECRSTMAELGPSLELLLETNLRAIG